MLNKELRKKIENENLDRCRVCLNFSTCKIMNKEEIADCSDFKEKEEIFT
ncbi:MAG: hypothetical protein ACQCN5_03920 [Candidatus Bathyarchaeia archaeon]|jgi:hypothetical protein